MNTLKNLVDNGIDIHTAERMLSDYASRIGAMNGVYEIIDINYDFSIRGRDITLRCSECGKIIHRTMIAGKNKWSELIKSCECQKVKAKRQQMLDSENRAKNKKALMFSDAGSMIGMEYGDYKIVAVEEKNNKPLFVLRCSECGNITTAPYESIKNDAKIHKHCTKHFVKVKFDENYIGQKKNCLKIIGITRFENNRKAFLCECDCGNKVLVKPTFWDNETVKSCGCKKEELLSMANRKENPVSKMRIYHIYQGMKSRCFNKKSDNYANYGGRGITICQEWLDDFMNFYNWAIENGYEETLSIDRIEVNGNYEPSNCRWATNAEQQRNKRNNVYITIGNQTKVFKDWVVELGITPYMLRKLLDIL